MSLALKIFSCLLFLSTLLLGHPHTFIDVYPSIEVEGEKTTKLHFKWKLDEMTSAMLIYEFDQDGDGLIDRNENYYVYKNYFLVLQRSDFYTEIKLKGKTQAIIEPKNFQVSIEENRICYAFELEESYNINDLSIEFGDKDMFVAMVLKPAFIGLKGAKAKMSEIDKDFYFVHKLELKAE